MQPRVFQQQLSSQIGAWDGGDLTGPAVLSGLQIAGRPWAMWYAANGDPQRPDYVNQIGLATSMDGTTWERRSAPVLMAPPFSGPGPDARPMKDRPDAYGLSDPTIVQVGGTTLWIYYAGLSCQDSCRYQIFRATSNDGVTFADSQIVWSGRDGVKEEAGGVAGPSVIMRDNVFYLAYTAVAEVPQRTRQSLRKAILSGSLGLAFSADGLHFTSATGARPLMATRQDYFDGGASSPALEQPAVGDLRMYFGGITNIADPAFAIGRALLRK